MSEPWYDANAWGWLLGTVYGCLAGLWGALAGTLAPQGKARLLIMGLGWLFIVSAAIFLAAAVTALCTGQPYGVWYGLGLPGLLGVVLYGALLPVARFRYRQAEERRMQAEDLG
jgi:multidrug transporter EmrE-like cation transporter